MMSRCIRGGSKRAVNERGSTRITICWLGGSKLRVRVKFSTRKSEDRKAPWRSDVIQVRSLHDRKRPSRGQADTAHACPIACHCERQSHLGRSAFGGNLRWQARNMGQEEQSALRA